MLPFLQIQNTEKGKMQQADRQTWDSFLKLCTHLVSTKEQISAVILDLLTKPYSANTKLMTSTYICSHMQTRFVRSRVYSWRWFVCVCYWQCGYVCICLPWSSVCVCVYVCVLPQCACTLIHFLYKCVLRMHTYLLISDVCVCIYVCTCLAAAVGTSLASLS